jgi:hypothetical protein
MGVNGGMGVSVGVGVLVSVGICVGVGVSLAGTDVFVEVAERIASLSITDHVIAAAVFTPPG